MLYIVSTPIGNLGDITKRAVEVLSKADFIVAEDTRRTGILMKECGVPKKPLIPYNEYNERRQTLPIISRLKQGETAALVSDSGTPGISDPGFLLVRECVKEGIQVSPVPGPSAIISALACSGLPTEKFAFYGFMPKKEQQKIKFLKSLPDMTTVFYESPYRIVKTLKVMAETIPERKVVIARELTKKFEEFIRGSAREVYERLKEKALKGEIVVLVGGSE